jgi:hypothetical protein
MAGAHALLPPVVDSIVIIGRYKVIPDSRAVLLDVKGYGRSKAYGLDSLRSLLLEPLQQLIVLDVSEFCRGASARFVESFNTTIGRQCIIALVPFATIWWAATTRSYCESTGHASESYVV